MKRILVGLDGSQRSDAILEAAIDAARRYDAKLLLFRGVGVPAGIPDDVWHLDPNALVDVLRERAETYLGECARRVPTELFEGTRVQVGSPWQSVCKAAADEHVDLIVIGSHGYSGFDRLLGTTAAKIVNHAQCSVLVIRDHE